MGRVINTESAGKDRTRLSKGIVLALRELMKQTSVDDTSKDLAVFIGLSLVQIAETIDPSVAAWEKRGYWVKADKFRMEWTWASAQGNAMLQALNTDDWDMIAQTSVLIAQKLMSVQVATHHRLGTPWIGAWRRYKAQKN